VLFMGTRQDYNVRLCLTSRCSRPCFRKSGAHDLTVSNRRLTRVRVVAAQGMSPLFICKGVIQRKSDITTVQVD
jgi:hypothetical protein